MSNFTALVIGGYSLVELDGNIVNASDSVRLTVGGNLASLGFLECLIDAKGDLATAGAEYRRKNINRSLSPPLNTILLCDFLRKKGGDVCAVNHYALEQDRAQDLLRDKPDIVVMSTTFIDNAEHAHIIADDVKRISPESVVVAGGIKVLKSLRKFALHREGYFDDVSFSALSKRNFFFNRETDANIDLFVIDENGLATLAGIVDSVKRGGDYRSLPNIAYWNGDTLQINDRVKEERGIDDDAIDWAQAPAEIIGQEIPVRAGIGCAHRCGFCDFSGLHVGVKRRKVESLIGELQTIQELYPGKPIFFTDDNLFSSRKRTREFADAIIRSGMKFPWRAFFRVDAISEDNAELVGKSGCRVAYLGVESGDDGILERMKKRSNRSKILNTVNLLNDNGVHTLSTLVVGFPGETKETIDNTIDMLNSYPQQRIATHKYYPFVFSVFPLAPISSPQNRQTYDIKGCYEKWSHSTMDCHQAREELVRMFHAVDGPPLGYMESIPLGMPVESILRLWRRREQVVKDGITSIDAENAGVVYQRLVQP